MNFQETIDELLDIPPTELPFISAYVNLSPELDAGTRSFGGPDPDAPVRSPRRSEEMELGHVRPGIRRLRDLFREDDSLFPLRGGERESFDADRERILNYLETSDFDNSAQGAAIFSCAGDDIWKVVELAVPVETKLYIAETPLLYPLIRVNEEFERFALCIADSQTARVYVIALGIAESEETIDGPRINYKMTGGLNQKRIQRRIENAVSEHIRDVARRLETLVEEDNISYIVLAGDEIVYSEFKNHLSETMWERVISIERLDIRTPKVEAIARAMEIAREAEVRDEAELVSTTLGQVRSHNLGAAGVTAVRYALEQGAVHILLLSPDFGESADREALTEMALQTRAQVEFVADNETLTQLGGVAALLRWRVSDAAASVE